MLQHSRRRLSLLALGLALYSCTHAQETPEDEPADTGTIDGLAPEVLRQQAVKEFGTLPEVMQSAKRTLSDAKIKLGRQLYYDPRLSKNQDLSCNSCHDLEDYGVDRRTGAGKTSPGHRGQHGTRNSPSVYNAARQIAQFWDGRAVDVEEQAKGPIVNPIEMAMKDQNAVVAVIKSIPGYAPLFQAAFSGTNSITYDNLAIAIGAFERKLVSKDRFDKYLAGDLKALTRAEAHGLNVFIRSGCPSCHGGPGIGGNKYEKLGAVMAFNTTDTGRFSVTGKADDRYVFKVPSLRNVAETAPYFHDGSQPTLVAAVRVMAEYQTINGKLSDDDVNAIVAFLETLSGELPADYIAEPPKLPGGASTPAPDPS